MLVRQLEEEVVKSRQHAKETNPEIKAHIEALQVENDHLTREVAILKETIKVRSIHVGTEKIAGRQKSVTGWGVKIRLQKGGHFEQTGRG